MEVAAWRAAEAQTAVWEGDYSLALRKFDEALAWDSDQPGYLVLRSEVHLQQGDIDAALADAEQALELAPRNMAVQEAYTTALTRAGRAEEAAAFYDKRLQALGDYSPLEKVLRRNQVAYSLALAGKDLDRALEQINLALDELKASDDRPALGLDESVLSGNQLALLDTRAMVLYGQGKLKQALADMNAVIREAEARQGQVEKLAQAHSIDDRHREQQLHTSRRPLATYYYHRALMHEAQAAEATGDQRIAELARAALDRDRVRELGFTPDETLF